MKKSAYLKVMLGAGALAVITACGGEENLNDDNNAGAENNNDNNNTEEASGDDVTLELYSSMTAEGERGEFEDLIAEFEEENPNISIEANFPGGSYEDQLRVMMAADDVPDLFDTHGWSQLRYGEYVRDLSGMDWVDDLDEQMEDIVTDEDGKVYTYPMNQAQDGVIYNEDVLDEHGIEPPTNWDDFREALETIRDESGGQVAPLWIPGGDDWTLAQMVDQMMTPMFETHPDHDYTDEFQDGSFDWSNYEPMGELMLGLHEDDLLNQDVLTAQFAQAPEIMASGQAGFMFIVGSIGPDAQEVNPDANIGLVPTPAYHDGDDPSWIGGERNTISISEDADHPEEAEKFIEFMTEDEPATRIAEATNVDSALEHIEPDAFYSEYYDRYSDVEVIPYFDRVHLPSGMWDVMATTTAELLSDGDVEGAAQTMGSEYERLREEDDGEDDLDDIDEEDIEDFEDEDNE
ncbi:ABC transporter substrate-binding protein [Salisediminibacterium halotolerans]|uniref:Raffinose/stachyose/melibiose transport system substrate-binding protein n=1 Tax=Salisediminibacterium halotolerans TaxID=517425 RepID=A0A1H9QM93_9BACI|nr:ABC transporter substrate-binding protein [Salisediminibacterium haloalkalitolerans]SER61558.1 raffinose/stachyose/melibiose transport system substrate-binding protein [Salisediminibacterium haloalkalitolerans]